VNPRLSTSVSEDEHGRLALVICSTTARGQGTRARTVAQSRHA
jgi:hypothetical protein